jgi:hypothetical protein
MEHILIKFTKEVILGIILEEAPYSNSSSESGGKALQDKMMKSDFQWPEKPQGKMLELGRKTQKILSLKFPCR